MFAVVNGIYTSLPTIRYSPQAILGIRIGSIPLEDFFYNLAYLGLTLVVYLASKTLLGL
jgi:lycopene cyclase domain-containing protein